MSKPSVVECSVPNSSEVFKHINLPSYSDCYSTNIEHGISATDAYRAIFGHTSLWIMALMSVRNRIAAMAGLKDLSRSELANAESSIHQTPYITGKRAGMFSVISVSEKELILGDNDKHLNFRISVLINNDAEPTVYLSTVVEEHNWAGRLYMFFVKPIHRIIAPYVVRKAKSEGRV